MKVFRKAVVGATVAGLSLIPIASASAATTASSAVARPTRALVLSRVDVERPKAVSVKKSAAALWINVTVVDVARSFRPTGVVAITANDGAALPVTFVRALPATPDPKSTYVVARMLVRRVASHGDFSSWAITLILPKGFQTAAVATYHISRVTFRVSTTPVTALTAVLPRVDYGHNWFRVFN